MSAGPHDARFGSMTVAQISDLHVVAEGQDLFGVLDTLEPALAAVRHLGSLSPAPDVVLVTGDLTGSGTPEEYAHARRLLDGLGVPYFVIPGNHDDRRALLEAFEGHAHADPHGFVQYTVEGYPARLVALDTLDEGNDSGLVDDERLAWLDSALAARPDTPTLVFMHHSPFPTGVWWIDALGLVGAEALADVIRRHPQVKLVACGHVHRGVTTQWAGTTVSTAPGVAFAVFLDMVPGSTPKVTAEPGACLLHVLDGDRFLTHTSYTNSNSRVIDVSQAVPE